MTTDEPYLTTRELADLLRIKERKVYDLAASGEVPCTKVIGKLLFPRDKVEAWLASGSSGPSAAAEQPRPAIVLGSHDPLLDWAIRDSRCGLASNFDSSLDGVERFLAGDGMLAGVHVFDAVNGDWNSGPRVGGAVSGLRCVRVEWAKRSRGLIVAAGREKDLASLSALPGHRFVPRQAKAGSQVLFEHLLGDAGLDPSSITLTRPARSEADAATVVLDGKADAAFGLAALAQQFRLGFVPIIEERYDLIVDRYAWFEEPFQTLLAFCRSEEFAERAGELAGYDVSDRFRVRANGAV